MTKEPQTGRCVKDPSIPLTNPWDETFYVRADQICALQREQYFLGDGEGIAVTAVYLSNTRVRFYATEKLEEVKRRVDDALGVAVED